MSKWVSVKKRLPKEDLPVLCFLEDGDQMVLMCRYDDWHGGMIWVDGGFGTGEYDVLAWQPLPKPYKAESSDDYQN